MKDLFSLPALAENRTLSPTQRSLCPQPDGEAQRLKDCRALGLLGLGLVLRVSGFRAYRHQCTDPPHKQAASKRSWAPDRRATSPTRRRRRPKRDRRRCLAVGRRHGWFRHERLQDTLGLGFRECGCWLEAASGLVASGGAFAKFPETLFRKLRLQPT